jgi:hypothetical protein
MATLTQIIGYLYSAEGTVLTQGVLSMRLQQDIVSVDGTKVAPTLISQDLSTSAGLFNKSVYATVGASPAGVAYFVEFDPDPTNVDVPPNQKEGYWFNYWSVPNTSSVALGSFLTAHRGEPYINYMPLGGGGGTVGGSGTTGYIPIWASGSSLSNSLLQQSGSILTMTGQFRASGAFAIYDFYESDQGVDGKFWRWIADGGQLMLQSVNDAYNSASTLVTFSRAGGLTLTVPLAVGSGGTGRSSWTTGDLVYASSSSALSPLAAAAAGRVLVSGTTPAWSATPTLTGLTLASLTFTGGSVLSGATTNLVELRNGTSAQDVRIYETFTDASNYRRFAIITSGSTTYDIGSYSAGTGGTGAILGFVTNSTRKWQIDETGHFKAQIDNTYDIGTSGNLRPRDFYIARNGAIGGTLSVTGNVTFGANVGTSSFVSQTTGWRITSSGDADFRSTFLEALHAKSFMIDLEQASAGGRIETKGVAVLSSAFTVPAPGAPVSSITRSGSVATVTTSSAHGFSNGDSVAINGAVQPEYNGVYTITVTDPTHYTYTVSGTPATPATGSIIAQGGANMVVEDLPGSPGMQVFAQGDTIVLRTFTRSNGGLIIGDCVGGVSFVSSGSGVQTWYVSRNQAAGTTGSLARGTVIPAKALVLDYGVSGNGYIESTTIDGTVTVTSITRVTTTATVTTDYPHGYQTNDIVLVSGATQTQYNGAQTITVTGPTTFTFAVAGSPATPATGTILLDLTNGTNAPYTQIVTWVSAPTAVNKTLRTRLGNLRGVTGTLEYGILAGSYGASNGAYFRASNQNFDLHGITAKWWDSTTNVIIISPNSGSPYISIGSPAPTAYGNNAGLFLGWSHSSLKAQASFYSDASNFWQFDGTKVTWKGANSSLDASGNLTATGGTIGGWTLGATSLVAGSGANTVGLDSGGTNPAIYAGSATPGSAPFRVTKTGAVTATSGTVGGWTLSSTTLTGGSATLDSAGDMTLGTTSNVVRLSATDATYRLWIGNATAGSAPFRVDKTGAATMTSVSISAGGVTLDSTGLFISPVSAAGGGAYANANAVRWTSSTTNRTAIWRTDDTSTSIHTFNLDHIDTGAGVNILTATSKVNGTISGYGQAYTTHYSTATIGMWKALADSNVTAQKTAYIWMYATGGSPFAQAQFGTGTAPSGTPDTPGTLTAGIDVTSSATISIIGTSKLLCASDSTTYTQTNGTLVTGNNVDTLGLSGNSAAVNLNFYLNAVADRKATIQAFNGGTNGGRLTIYTKADGSASMAANTTFNEAGDISVTRNASIGGYVNPTNLTVGRAGQGGTSGSTYSIYWTGAVAQLWIDSTNVGNITLTSDRRIKRNITPLPSTLSSIMQLNPGLVLLEQRQSNRGQAPAGRPHRSGSGPNLPNAGDPDDDHEEHLSLRWALPARLHRPHPADD